MRRSLKRWADTKPEAVVAGSRQQAIYCIEDAKADIAELAACINDMPTVGLVFDTEEDMIAWNAWKDRYFQLLNPSPTDTKGGETTCG